MTDAVLDKVATAIAMDLGGYGYFCLARDDDACRAIARAALIALRDGVDSPVRIAGAEGADIRPTEAEASFIAMLNHVLQEGEKDTESVK